MLLSRHRLVVGAGITAAAVAFYHVHSQPESYHLLQTIPRTGRLLSWATASYLRYHAEVSACGDPSQLSTNALSNLQRVNARELAEVWKSFFVRCCPSCGCLGTALAPVQVCKSNGGIFIKAAQFASNIATVPTEFREELGQLRDNSCVLSGDVVRAMIEADTKQSVDTLFKHLSDQPIAAASLAQACPT